MYYDFSLPSTVTVLIFETLCKPRTLNMKMFLPRVDTRFAVMKFIYLIAIFRIIVKSQKIDSENAVDYFWTEMYMYDFGRNFELTVEPLYNLGQILNWKIGLNFFFTQHKSL